MSHFDYTFVLSSCGRWTTRVEIINHRIGSRHVLFVKMNDHAALGSVPSESFEWERAADIFSLATAIHVADRMAIRRGDEVCRLRIVLPVWRPEVLADASNYALLRKVLSYYTEDEWCFEWQQKDGACDHPVMQRQLCLGGLEEAEVALWSGGLDAAAGLICRAQEFSDRRFVLVGAGANSWMLGVQRQVFDQVSPLFPRRLELRQLPIHVTGSADLPKNFLGRVRGLVFTLSGGVYAYLQGQDRLHLYENGPGAINLPYCAAELGVDHARSVHPCSLQQVGDLLQGLLGAPMRIDNPFLLLTKGQMCEPLKYLSQAQELIATTVSCDSPHRHPDRPNQCGYCTSCLLRRQALASAGIDDPTRYAVDYKPFRTSDAHPLRAMLHQVRTFKKCGRAAEPWRALRQEFPQITDALSPNVLEACGSVEAARAQVLALYLRYSGEWDAVEPLLWRSLAQEEQQVA